MGGASLISKSCHKDADTTIITGKNARAALKIACATFFRLDELRNCD
ncbi:MAG TPA: hypothetical protein PLW02_03685 [Verrucomicrobiota bacterium]|nr:hypothetical protein [Verrucomicrobiota bacterium]